MGNVLQLRAVAIAGNRVLAYPFLVLCWLLDDMFFTESGDILVHGFCFAVTIAKILELVPVEPGSCKKWKHDAAEESTAVLVGAPIKC